MRELLILGGFVVVEAVFHQVERWCEHHRESVKTVKHGALIAYVMHPSVTAAAAEWVNHTLTVVVALGH